MIERHYELRQELSPAHGSDVKAVLAVNDECIASASRDQSVGLWKLDEDGQFVLKALLAGHAAYVNCLAHIPTQNGDLLASGGNSSLILLHSLVTMDPQPIDTLIGHSLNVCTLKYSKKRRKLISGSWDCTARIWSREDNPSRNGGSAHDNLRIEDDLEGAASGWSTELVLDGHEQAVWGVMCVDEGPKEGCYLTGSADRLINLWSETGELVMRFKGSPEPVRSLTSIPGGTSFASACNDGLVRIWDYTGSVIRVLKGHTDYAYDVVSSIDGARLVSCGEDHTARVWYIEDENKKTETLLHPCQTVWCIDILPNGDIVSAGSDGKLRLWSQLPERQVQGDIRSVYEQEVAEGMKNYASGETPTREVEAPKTLTIDIDTGDDTPNIPLTFNVGDDPEKVARDLGREHELSENYIARITEFIELHIRHLG